MILVDANVLMYAAGAEHPHKGPSLRFLERVAVGDIVATIDAELLQEVLHRYRSLNRWSDGRQVYELARQIFPEVLAIDGDVMDRALRLLDAFPGLLARDGVHAAVVLVKGLSALCSYDRDFEQIPDFPCHPPEFWL